MLKILYDHQIFTSQKFGGISRCFIELLKHMPNHIHTQLCLAESDNEYALEYGIRPIGTSYKQFICNKNFFGKNFLYKLFYNLRFYRLSSWKKFPNINLYTSIECIRRGDYDIFHPTFFNDYYLQYVPKGKHIVITIHDLIPEIFKDLFADDFQLLNRKKLIDSASHIIAVSQNTKDDIVRIYGVDENMISVVYHGVDEKPYYPKHDDMNGVPYLLYVGGRWNYKNFIPFCKEAIPVLTKYKNLRIVITGNALDDNERNILEELGILDKIIHKYCVSTQEIMDLYHYAVCFVYPSAYEGFGIPILEAFKADCPVMLNEASCFPEIAGDAAVYFHFDERGKSDFSEKFTEFYENADLRKDLLSKQRMRLNIFSWEKSAETLYHVYSKVVNK